MVVFLVDMVTNLRNLAALSLGAVLLGTQSAATAPLTYDCQSYITRVETVPPVVAGDAEPWQCRAPSVKPSSATHWFRNSLEYCRLTVGIYDQALRSAQRMAATHKRQRWIVFLDADETVLDNSLFERERDMCVGEFHDAQWESWVRADMAGAIPGAAAFTQAVHHLGGLIAIVTNRSAADDGVTQHTLRTAGIWFDTETGMTDTSDKTLRWQGAVKELTRKFGSRPKPVMWLGDQVSDLAIVDARGAIMRAMNQKDEGGAVGTHLFILPNPMYGNWTKNPAN